MIFNIKSNFYKDVCQNHMLIFKEAQCIVHILKILSLIKIN